MFRQLNFQLKKKFLISRKNVISVDNATVTAPELYFHNTDPDQYQSGTYVSKGDRQMNTVPFN